MARREDKELADLLDKFACVRMVQMWGVDLSVFQFDGSLTWAVMFVNADKTVYGRYGSRSGPNGSQDVSLEGLKKAMEGALELHKGYPGNKKELAGKTGPAPKWRLPETFPAVMYSKSRYADGTATNACIHCHVVDDGMIRGTFLAGQRVPDTYFFSYPMPDVAGLSLDVRERATVASVAPGSAAEKAGFKAGDRILRLEGQPVISIADVQWVLHNAKEPATVKAEVDRGGQKAEVSLALAAGWRRRMDITWREEIHYLRMGLELKEASAQERGNAGAAPGGLCLRVEKNNPQSLPFAGGGKFVARASGLVAGDLIIAIDGKSAAMSPSEFVAYLWQQKRPGQKVEFTVSRGGRQQRVTMDLP